MIFSIKILPTEFTVSMFSSPVGAFLTFALLAAAVVAFRDHVEARANKEAK
jgi:electron transport complex protein RnfE